MDLTRLQDHLAHLMSSLPVQQKGILEARLQGLSSVFPFSEYEYMLMFLLDKETITFEQYEQLRSTYVSSNRFLDLYGLAPRVFGEIWGQEHIRDLDKRFAKPGKVLDPTYDGEYDVWIDGVKVEIKASRAIHTKVRGSLVSKALEKGSSKPFWMNFQQLKLDVADVFIFIGVWVNEITYWVLTNEEVRTNPYLSHQHRGGIEYQIGITHKNIREFDGFIVAPAKLADVIFLKADKGKG